MLIAWTAAIALKAFAAMRLYRNGTARLIPTLWIFLVAAVSRSLVLLYLEGSPQYASAYVLTTPFMIAAEGFAIVGIFWRMVEHYPNFRRAGSIFLAVLACLGAAVGWQLQLSAASPWQPLIRASLWLQTYGAIAMLVVLAGARVALPKSQKVPIRRSSQRAADVMALGMLLNLAGAAFAARWGREYGTIARLLPPLGGIVISALWAALVDPRTDATDEPQYLSAEGFRSAQQSALRAVAGLRRAAR